MVKSFHPSSGNFLYGIHECNQVILSRIPIRMINPPEFTFSKRILNDFFVVLLASSEMTKWFSGTSSESRLLNSSSELSMVLSVSIVTRKCYNETKSQNKYTSAGLMTV